MTYVKLGTKGRHLDIPEGWDILRDDELIMSTDLVANLYTMEWELVGDEDDGEKAEIFDFVIRERPTLDV